MARLSSTYSGSVNMDVYTPARMEGMAIDWADEELIVLRREETKESVQLRGSFTYDSEGNMTGGVINAIHWLIDGRTIFSVTELDLQLMVVAEDPGPGTPSATWDDIFTGNDSLGGYYGDDLLRGGPGDDVIRGGFHADTLYGGAGDDRIFGHGAEPPNFYDYAPVDTQGRERNLLRGEEGNDTLTGSHGFDDMHGNQGNDSLTGGGGDDWVVGGKDNDVLYGDAGSDVVLGNLGNDTLDGGEALDIMRGGQADDVLRGQAGDDWMSGDRGDDTLTGGDGADTFHIFAQSGLDRVTDFNAAQGDRVNVLAGSQHTAYQQGADTVVEVTDGSGDVGRMVLAGVQLSSLPSGWIFVG